MAFVIAFDLDGTLIPTQNGVPVEENYNPFWKIFFHEKIRRGTKDMILKLQNQGCDIWIYTTSFRRVKYIHRMFLAMGIKLTGVVNQIVHYERMVKVFGNRNKPSKSPSTFGIDLLVDDEPEIKKEALIYGFDALLVDQSDQDWVNKVLDHVKSMRDRA